MRPSRRTFLPGHEDRYRFPISPVGEELPLSTCFFARALSPSGSEREIGVTISCGELLAALGGGVTRAESWRSPSASISSSSATVQGSRMSCSPRTWASRCARDSRRALARCSGASERGTASCCITYMRISGGSVSPAGVASEEHPLSAAMAANAGGSARITCADSDGSSCCGRMALTLIGWESLVLMQHASSAVRNGRSHADTPRCDCIASCSASRRPMLPSAGTLAARPRQGSLPRTAASTPHVHAAACWPHGQASGRWFTTHFQR